ncbi:hypothetical protein LAZ67_8001713 [Cordylochernes scorpioides]|uniref:Uncharacterized protein n=1 Tax=Cordylochernes scorpioides TaxID=51811 RepID=A0ABY6KQF5_9ARAC|nr:hypothetical protein LAZ67_8001713 [Cordylochernes scorpioides]
MPEDSDSRRHDDDEAGSSGSLKYSKDDAHVDNVSYPYSPDLVPNDFFIFPRMKSVLNGHRFDTVNAIKEKSLSVLRALLLTNFLGASGTGKKE